MKSQTSPQKPEFDRSRFPRSTNLKTTLNYFQFVIIFETTPSGPNVYVLLVLAKRVSRLQTFICAFSGPASRFQCIYYRYILVVSATTLEMLKYSIWRMIYLA